MYSPGKKCNRNCRRQSRPVMSYLGGNYVWCLSWNIWKSHQTVNLDTWDQTWCAWLHFYVLSFYFWNILYMHTTGFWSRSLSPGRVKNFSFSTSSRPDLGPTQPPIQWVPPTLSPGVKLPGCETDHSSPSSAGVKKMWIYRATPPFAFME
jgi:hypothetical protein